MRRIVVIGAGGFFGRLIVDQLRARGLEPTGAGRKEGDLLLDVEDSASLARTLRRGDVVIDTAGPFQARSMTLIRAAMSIGFDVIDLSDSARYSGEILSLSGEISASGIRVLTACSSLSVVSALAIRRSGLDAPERLTVFLAPASRFTANRATAASLLSSVRERRLTLRRVNFPPPAGRRSAVEIDSVDRITLRGSWPSLRETAFLVDTQVPMMNRVLILASRSNLVHALLTRAQPAGVVVSRVLGSRSGVLLVEVAAGSRVSRMILWGNESYLIAALPAVLAGRSLAEDRVRETGVIAADRQVNGEELVAELHEAGINVATFSGPA